MSAPTAFGAGAGFMTLSVKFLVFTLAVISAIGDAHLGTGRSVLTYLFFVVLAQIIPYSLLAIASTSASRTTAMLDALNEFLRRKNKVLTVLFGLIFGTWFLVKALKQLHVI